VAARIDVPTQDLAAHYGPLAPQLEAAALRVLRSGRYVDGPEVAAFEVEAALALAVPHAVGLSSGTDGLLALLTALGIGPGDQVITTPFSFFASVEAIVRTGAIPVFADIEPDTLNLDPDAAVARVGPGTRAVLVVHLFGRAARLAPVEDACAAAHVPIVEDAAQAVGARAGQRPVGTLGSGAAISFFPAKNLGGFGDGGMVLTRDPALAQRVRLLRAHGARARYQHTLIGGNFRLDELQAALLRVKLPHLPRWTERRRAIAAHYREQLRELPLALPPDDPGCVWNQLVVRVPEGRRDPLRAFLADRKIATAVYYPEPLHLQPALAGLGHRRGDFPNAERACAEVLALPIFPELPDQAVDRVSEAIRDFFALRGGGPR
jgi:dTDP-4-amino-4,6-dideoxygalactose transaminase